MTEDLNTIRETRNKLNSALNCHPNAVKTLIEEALAALDRLEAATAAGYERGRQDGMKQEHALWHMQRIGQEIEAAAVPEDDDLTLAYIAGYAKGVYGGVAKAKTAVPVGEVKPVAWMYTYKENDGRGVKFTEKQAEAPEGGWKHYVETPLYTTPPAPPEGTVTLELAMMLKQCIYRLRKYGHPDIADRGLALLQRHDLVGSPLRDEFEPSSHAAATINAMPAAPQPGDKK